MAKSKITKDLEKEIFNSLRKRGVFFCFEVTIGWYGKERVDMLSYDTKGVFRCYEIKSSVEDFRSKAKKTFLGHYNYYVMPQEVYDKVKDEIPKEIGVYIHGVCVKKSKKQELDNDRINLLKDSMLRSLYRYFEEVTNNADETVIKQKDRYIGQLKRDRNNYRQMYWDMKKKYEPYGSRNNKKAKQQRKK